MDIYDFQNNLTDIQPSDTPIEVMQALYDATTKMLAHERNELKLATALVDTAHTLLWTSNGRDGVKAFIKLLENNLDDIHRARTLTAMQERTRDIEKNNNKD